MRTGTAMMSTPPWGVLLCAASFFLVFSAAFSSSAENTVYYYLEVYYKVLSPLGVPQKVITVNGTIPGPLINTTTNWDLVVNVLNGLDEPLLLTWEGLQHRRNSWQDGVLGTNCPILPGWNWTYQFQVKDQIGSFFYFPSVGLQRAAGGFGAITVNNRHSVPVPFAQPDGDVMIFIGDWYTKNHTDLRRLLDEGKVLGIPDGVLINGKGPYRPYTSTLLMETFDHETINVEPGKTYRVRVHNIGTSTSLNFRIQNHNLLLVEAEGTYTNQQNYTSLDIHVGQSYSFLVTMDQNASTDYYIVASARFVNESAESDWARVTGVALLHYSNSQGTASGPLPDLLKDFYYRSYSMDQAKTIKMNTTAGAARPNPQGSFHYGSINITNTYLIRSAPPLYINEKRRSTLNGISYTPADTPLRLADLHELEGVYTLDFPSLPNDLQPRMGRSAINASYKGFIEIVFQNNDTRIHTYHLDGYAFFVVGMDYGEWSESSRTAYNKWDAISRSTTQVFPGAWTAVLVSLDNVGIWNLRSENLDKWYLGEEVYVRVADPGGYNRTEVMVPHNVLYCGLLSKLQQPQTPHAVQSSASSLGVLMLNLAFSLSVVISALI